MVVCPEHGVSAACAKGRERGAVLKGAVQPLGHALFSHDM